MDQKLKIGALRWPLGENSLAFITESEAYELVGFYDSQPQIAAKISREFGYRSFSDVNSLFAQVDVVDIVTPSAILNWPAGAVCISFWKSQLQPPSKKLMSWFLWQNPKVFWGWWVR